MSCERETADSLRRANYKVTPQRLLIATVLRHAGSHMSATEIADEVRKEYPFVDVSTVYRTLDMLKGLRLVTATDMAQGDVMFEWATEEPHHHLICSQCRHPQELDHRYFDSLAEAIRAAYDFEPDLHHFAIFGTCRWCRDAEKPVAGRSE